MQKPLTIVVFGATGDLFKKKLAKAFFDLYQEKFLPVQTSIYGFSRKNFTEDEFRKNVVTDLNLNSEKDSQDFLQNVFYRQGDILKEDTYKNLKEELTARDELLGECSHKLFYLAVTPELYEPVFNNLSRSGLTIPCAPAINGGEGTWIRVLVEKPFGENPIQAEMLDMQLGSLFLEEQIFRVDHYLAKETIQNIIAFRFANCLFESLWNKDYVESIYIKSYEKEGINGRGTFYDKFGALKDVGQNHLLQMLALVTMDKPLSFSSVDIRRARAEVFSKVAVSESSENFVRAQYQGYSEEKDVSPGSQTETFFRLGLEIKNERWSGVPIYIEHGKALSESLAEIIIKFKPNCSVEELLFPDSSNTLIFHIQPKEGISVGFMSKKSGLGFELEKKMLSFDFGNGGPHPFDYPYKKLLKDALDGDQTLFVSTEELKGEWRIVGDILKIFETIPLCVYDKGTKPENIGK